jgi:carboxylesterase type B
MLDFPVVETEYGKVRGVKKVSALNADYNSFLGIQYATLPLRDLRFKVSFTINREVCLHNCL